MAYKSTNKVQNDEATGVTDVAPVIEVKNDSEDILKKQLEESNLKTKELQNQIDELMKMIKNSNETKTIKTATNALENYTVPVESLCMGKLNITDGNGITYSFTSFGENSEIPYEEIKSLINKNRNVFTNGSIYINDKDVVKKHNLEVPYRKIFDKDFLESVSKETDKIKFIEKFTQLNDYQKKTVLKLIINIMKNDVEFDMNILDYLNMTYATDIKKIVSDAKAIMEMGNKN